MAICLSICTLWRPSVTFHARPGGRHDQRPPASRASVAPLPEKQGMAICFESVIASFFCVAICFWIVIIGDLRSVRRPDSSVESGLGLLLPYCRIEKRNPAYKLRAEGACFLRNHLHMRVKSSSRVSFARRSAFLDMENVYFEDYAGVSPQWLAVRVRVQGGLIPAYGDSFLCCRVPLRASFAWRSAFHLRQLHEIQTATPLKCL